MADREKLIALLCEAHSKSTDEVVFHRATYAQQLEMEADHLIANGVTVRERGRWLYDSGGDKFFCPVCDEEALSFKKDTLYGGDLYEVCLTDFCPNCGADMRGEEDA